MPHPVRVYNAKGTLIRIHTRRELELRSDKILKAGFQRPGKNNRPVISKNCPMCLSAFKTLPM